MRGQTGPLEAGMVLLGVADTEPTEPYSVRPSRGRSDRPLNAGLTGQADGAL